jgi:hypothetical protein
MFIRKKQSSDLLVLIPLSIRSCWIMLDLSIASDFYVCLHCSKCHPVPDVRDRIAIQDQLLGLELRSTRT